MNEAPLPGVKRPSETEADTLVDRGAGTPPPEPRRTGSRPPSSSSLDGGRFTPGEIVDARYRVVGLLGRGGMGEVYRAEDLRLGEPVALKFLPEQLVRDGAALARFHREVRTARLITHRNVVRVHDLGEIGGQPFLSMEYVDGEDLASLLRRIGRLPADKAIELARQLCAGLAAAHERGVLHRDLKPGNVLVDGRGHAKITDFGLAALASDLESPELAGTPFYMAPEQLGEGRVSYSSDIYSLGLVLYEMFTGHRPFPVDEPSKQLEEQRRSSPPRLSTHVDGLDPRVEEVVLRCLRVEPERRPSSAIDVAAALPGGDPLAAALAAGETPSPEMVARAQGAGALSRPRALLLVALAIGGTALFLVASTALSTIKLTAPLPPQVLAHQARSVLAEVGFAADHDAWDYWYSDFAQHRLQETRADLAGWREIARERPGFLEFWYRSADRPLLATRRGLWRVTLDDPPPTTPGTATVVLDGQGRLRSLLIAPASPVRDAAAATATPDWAPLFAAAELPLEAFAPATADRAPPVYGDLVAAWTGAYPGQVEPRLAVEAAARDGRVVFFRVREVGGEGPLVVEGLPASAMVGFALMWIVGGLLARRHLRTGSGDRRGAARLAAAVAFVTFLGPLLLAHHAATASEELPLVFSALAQGAMFGVVTWLLYMALEPFSRRVAPGWVVSWARLLEGRARDPMVGRDVLSGIAVCATTFGVLQAGTWLFAERARVHLDWLYPHGLAPLEGALPTLANVLHPAALLVPIGAMSVMIASLALLRRRWLAALVSIAIVGGFDVLVEGVHLPMLGLSAVLVLVGFRWGLLAQVAGGIFVVNLTLVPVAADPSLWWSANSWLGWGPVLLLALWGYRTATTDRARERV